MKRLAILGLAALVSMPFTGASAAGNEAQAGVRPASCGSVKYEGNVVRNPHVRRNLEALRCGLSREGYPPETFDLIVSGGESYVGGKGRVFSVTNRQQIEPRNRRSAHNVENGARAVDIWRSPGISDAAFRRVLARYTSFVSPIGHGREHWHLRLPDRGFDCPTQLCVLRPGPRGGSAAHTHAAR
jgi:hypothetical protein